MPPRQPPQDPGSDLPESDPWDRPSKTQRKKDSHELQALGEDLVELSEEKLCALPMDESLREALLTHKRTRSHEGRRRQMQYIGKLMRRADPEPLREAVAAMKLGTAKSTLALHEMEHWRAQMLAGDDILTEWMKQHPGTDLQQLRSLVRAARKDAAAAPEQRNGRAYRELFQLIKQHHGGAPAPSQRGEEEKEEEESDD